MSVIQYFLPGFQRQGVVSDGKLNRDSLDSMSMELSDVLRDIVHVPRDVVVSGVKKGPGEMAGVLLTPTTFDGAAVSVTFSPGHLWRQSTNKSYWLGVGPGGVTPPDLQRRQTYVGYTVSGTGGKTWTVPIARSNEESRVSLPAAITFGQSGLQFNLSAQYDELWRMGGHIIDWWLGNESQAASFAARVDIALAALACNYRVGRNEVNLAAEAGTPILSTDLVTPICLSLADIAFAEEHKKKDCEVTLAEARDSSKSPNGARDECATTPVGES